MKQRPSLSEDELVAYLKKTSLVTLLVEGTADAFVYRCLESKLPQTADVLTCGGRSTMLSVYKRKDEFISSKAIFMADRDMWFFTGIPDDYAQDIVYTQGYSIENDMYLPETFESLLSSEEAENFRLVLNQVVLWFSVQVAKALSGGAADCKAHVNHLCPECELADEFKVVIATSPPNQQLVDQIAANYHLALRGKSLFELLVRFLSHQKRQSKFSKYNLLELGSKLQNPKADSLIAAISQRIP